MKIRSVTAFVPLTWPIEPNAISNISRFLADARWRFSQAGFEVQTVRLATPPFLDVMGDPDPLALLDFAQSLEELAVRYNIDFVSVGPVIATTPLAFLMPISILPRLMTETERVFSGVLFADRENGINMAAAQAFAQTVLEVSKTTEDGFGNLRLAALANVGPNIPFFPASYHGSGPPCFSIATQAADLALRAIQAGQSLNDIRVKLIELIDGAGASITNIAGNLVSDHNIAFKGIDFSLAPFPSEHISIGTAIQQLGLDAFGSHGSLFATAFFTNCIRQAKIPLIGFSGIMLPILEDTLLADAAQTGHFSVNDLLLYSAVCGTGLDTVPLPGDVSVDDLAAILLDVAGLAQTLDKPLTARLMPLPGLSAGDPVSFDFEYFAPGYVLSTKGLAAPQIFQRSSFFNTERPRPRKRSTSNIYPEM